MGHTTPFGKRSHPVISHCAAVIMSDRTSEERKALLWLTVAGLSVHCQGRQGEWLLWMMEEGVAEAVHTKGQETERTGSGWQLGPPKTHPRPAPTTHFLDLLKTLPPPPSSSTVGDKCSAYELLGDTPDLNHDYANTIVQLA